MAKVTYLKDPPRSWGGARHVAIIESKGKVFAVICRPRSGYKASIRISKRDAQMLKNDLNPSTQVLWSWAFDKCHRGTQ